MADILIVDDNPIMHRTLSVIMRKIGHQAIVAHGGEQALTILASTPVRLAIIDMNMPGMGGLELLEKIRASESGNRLPVVFLTGSGQKSDQQSALALGADGFLNKPVSSHQLRDLINQLLDRGE